MEQPRLFTLAEATALLPAVRELITTIQTKKRRLDSLSAELEGLIETASGNGHSSGSRMPNARAETEVISTELHGLLAELQAMGCQLKGIEEGLVDFPSMREGRVVNLCWKLGEDEIRFWHDLDSGFANRQPL